MKNDDFEYVDPIGSTLVIRENSNWSNDTFGIFAVDEGGFTGVIVPFRDWQKIKDHIDKLIEEKMN